MSDVKKYSKIFCNYVTYISTFITWNIIHIINVIYIFNNILNKKY